jgi:hypothetical protein
MSFTINYDAIRKRIEEVSVIDSEIVYFVKQKKEPCSECIFDPIRRESTNPFCPVCGGKGFVTQDVKTAITACVDRATGLENVYQAGGRLQKGDVVMTVHERELVKAGYPLDADWATEFDWIEIAGRKYILAEGDSVIPQTLQGQIYEVIFHLSHEGRQ